MGFSLFAELVSDESLILVGVKATVIAIAFAFVVVNAAVATFFELIVAAIVFTIVDVDFIVFIDWLGPKYFV